MSPLPHPVQHGIDPVGEVGVGLALGDIRACRAAGLATVLGDVGRVADHVVEAAGFEDRPAGAQIAGDEGRAASQPVARGIFRRQRTQVGLELDPGNPQPLDPSRQTQPGRADPAAQIEHRLPGLSRHRCREQDRVHPGPIPVPGL